MKVFFLFRPGPIISSTFGLSSWKVKSTSGKALRKKCPWLELFWSVFSRIRTEYGKIWTKITPNTETFHAVKSFVKFSRSCTSFSATNIYLQMQLSWNVSLMTQISSKNIQEIGKRKY